MCRSRRRSARLRYVRALAAMLTSHELRKAGKIGAIGISECSADTLRKAAKLCELSALQVEYSAWATHIERDGTLAAARELGIPVFGYSPIGRGLLSGTFKTAEEATSGPCVAFTSPC